MRCSLGLTTRCPCVLHGQHITFAVCGRQKHHCSQRELHHAALRAVYHARRQPRISCRAAIYHCVRSPNARAPQRPSLCIAFLAKMARKAISETAPVRGKRKRRDPLRRRGTAVFVRKPPHRFFSGKFNKLAALILDNLPFLLRLTAFFGKAVAFFHFYL